MRSVHDRTVRAIEFCVLESRPIKLSQHDSQPITCEAFFGQNCPMSNLNASAKPFTFSASASSWTPSFGAPPAAPTPAPAAAPVAPPAPPAAPAVAEVSADVAAMSVSDAAASGEGDGEEDEKCELCGRGFDAHTAEELDECISKEDAMLAAKGESGEDAAPAAADKVVEEKAPKAEKAAPAEKAANAGDASPTPVVADEAEEEDEAMAELDAREHINLVFIGHVDAGKSTLSGSILYITGNVDKRTIERFEKEAKERNRESWFLAFIMDTNEEERAKGKTVEVGRAHFDTESKRYTILDAPGHKNYVPNMISGAAQADVGVLVISARRGEFEAGFDRSGQTREHALLAKTLGVKHLVVVVNKMDDSTVQWSQARFTECCDGLKPYLKRCGYKVKKEVTFLPISGLTGANVQEAVSKDVCAWWSGSTLMQTLDGMKIEGREPTAPLRLPIIDRYNERGTIVMTKVETGTLRVNDKITIMPGNKHGVVDAIFNNEVKVGVAPPGENVNIRIGGVGVEDAQKGFVVCSRTLPVRAVRTFIGFLALVELLPGRQIFTAGYNAVLHAHTAEEEVSVLELLEDDKGKKPPFVKAGQVLRRVRLQLAQAVCLEPYDTTPHLGRFTLRDEGKTIGIGKVVSVEE